LISHSFTPLKFRKSTSLGGSISALIASCALLNTSLADTATPDPPDFGQTSIVNIPDGGLMNRNSGELVDGNQLITSNGRYIFNLAYGDGTAYTAYKVRVFDPQNALALVKEFSIVTTSLYTDGISAKGDSLYAIQWTGANPANVVEINWQTEQIVNTTTIPQGTTQAIEGQYDWVNDVHWVGALRFGANIHSWPGTGISGSPTSTFSIQGTDSTSGAGTVASDGCYLYVKRWASSYPGTENLQRIGTGFGGTVAGQVYGNDIGGATWTTLSTTYHPDGYVYISGTANNQLQRVKVTADRTSPIITCPEDIEVPAQGPSGAVVNFSATAIDNDSANVVCVPASGSLFPVGVTEVTCTATDPTGNTAQCSFNVTVTSSGADTTPPVFSDVPKDIVITAGSEEGMLVFFGTPLSTDETSPANPSVTCDPASGSEFPLGTTTVTCTATDDAGNIGMATFSVTVLELHSEAPPMEMVSLRGESAPDAGGATGVPEGAGVFSHNRAFINDSGDVLYEAVLSGAGVNNRVIYRDDAGSSTALAVKGIAAPGAAGGEFGTFAHLAMNGGSASFRSTISNKPAHFSAAGIAPSLAVSGSGLVPDVVDAEFSVLQQPALTSSGSLVTPASMRIGLGGVDSMNDTGLWLDGTLLAREGSPSPLPVVRHGHFAPRAATSSGSNQLAFTTFLLEATFDPNTNTAIFAGAPATPVAVLRESDPAPDTGGAIFGGFACEVVNSSGEFATRATLRGAGVSAANNEGLWSNGGGAGLQLVAREGDVAPCLPDALAAFGRFTTLILSDDGTIHFHAYLKDATATPAVSATNDGSLWRFDPTDSSLHLIAREGDSALGTDGAAITRIDRFTATDNGAVAYAAALTNNIGDTTTSTNYGIWLGSDSENIANLILRRGDELEVAPEEEEEDARTVVSLTFDADQNSGGGTGGYGKALNDNGLLALRLSLSGNASGVFVVGGTVIAVE